MSASAVVVTLEPLVGAETYVNGKQITDAVILKQGTETRPAALNKQEAPAVTRLLQLLHQVSL